MAWTFINPKHLSAHVSNSKYPLTLVDYHICFSTAAGDIQYAYLFSFYIFSFWFSPYFWLFCPSALFCISSKVSSPPVVCLQSLLRKEAMQLESICSISRLQLKAFCKCLCACVQCVHVLVEGFRMSHLSQTVCSELQSRPDWSLSYVPIQKAQPAQSKQKQHDWLKRDDNTFSWSIWFFL